MNVSRPSTAAIGRTTGRITCQNTLHELQPSTRAAAISSLGTPPAMYWRIRKTPKAVTRFGAITALMLLSQPKWIISM